MFVGGDCIDVLIRVETTVSSGAAAVFEINDHNHNGPWVVTVPPAVGTYEQQSCMFSNDFTMRQMGAVGWRGTVSVVGIVEHFDTITIPNDESWIVQGAVVNGLPVKLDARLSTGTYDAISYANVVIRQLRFSAQTAPLDRYATLRAYPSYPNSGKGGAFFCEGCHGSTILFDNVVFE